MPHTEDGEIASSAPCAHRGLTISPFLPLAMGRGSRWPSDLPEQNQQPRAAWCRDGGWLGGSG